MHLILLWGALLFFDEKITEREHGRDLLYEKI